MSDRSNNRPMPSMISQPKRGDTDQAVDVLQELHAVLKRHGCVLAHQPNGMALGRVPPGLGSEVQVIAVAKIIAPDHFIWADIKWSEDGAIKPGEFKIQ